VAEEVVGEEGLLLSLVFGDYWTVLRRVKLVQNLLSPL
jgi:hypothetical protein